MFRVFLLAFLLAGCTTASEAPAQAQEPVTPEEPVASTCQHAEWREPGLFEALRARDDGDPLAEHEASPGVTYKLMTQGLPRPEWDLFWPAPVSRIDWWQSMDLRASLGGDEVVWFTLLARDEAAARSLGRPFLENVTDRPERIDGWLAAAEAVDHGSHVVVRGTVEGPVHVPAVMRDAPLEWEETGFRGFADASYLDWSVSVWWPEYEVRLAEGKLRVWMDDGVVAKLRIPEHDASHEQQEVAFRDAAAPLLRDLGVEPSFRDLFWSPLCGLG